MKNLVFLVMAAIVLMMASCNNTNKSTSSASTRDTVVIIDTVDSVATDSAEKPAAASPEVADELSKAVSEEHSDADAEYSYDAATNTVKIVKQVEVPADQAEEDYAEAIVEHEVPEFISQFKKSTKPSDTTIKSKGATITVSYVNKATGEEITQFDITPDDLK